MRLAMITLLWGLTGLVCPTRSIAAADAPSKGEIRRAVDQALSVMQKSLTEYPHHVTCFSCHHQGVPMFAMALARSHGYAVKEQTLSDLLKHTEADLRGDLASYQKGQGQPGGVTRAGYALLTLQAGGAKTSEITDAVTGYLLLRDKEQGFWRAGSNRPPAEASSFTNTFLAIRALKTFAAEPRKDEVKARIERAREWLEQTPPKDTEDRVFQIWGLREAGTEEAIVQKAVNGLLAEQREDGGWAQLPGANSDAYATGSALTVLTLAGRLSSNTSSYQSGITFLIRNQQPDGSWRVTTRSKPVQPYFESGFPHGRDQFISMAATGWSTAALALASPAVGKVAGR